MKKRDRKALAHYIRWVANEMELRDWTVELQREPAADNACATVRCVYGQKRALVHICEQFRVHAPEGQRHTIVHELVHCHLHPLAEQVEQDLPTLLGKPAETLFVASARRNLEYAVDALATAVAKHMPLIQWPE